MSISLPSPPPSPPSPPCSTGFLQGKPQYTRQCLGCNRELLWRCWMVQDDDFRRWYTSCDAGKDGCDWFQWALPPEGSHNVASSQTSSQRHTHGRSPPIEISSPGPSPSPFQRARSHEQDQDHKLQYPRRCFGCNRRLLYRRWMVQDDDFRRWYAYCGARQDDCVWFKWVPQPEGSHNIASPRTSSQHHTHGRSPSIEISSPRPGPSPFQHPHSHEQKQITPLSYARDRASSTHDSLKLPKKRTVQATRHRTYSIDHPPSLPPPHHHSLSTELPQPPRVWPFDFYADEMDAGFRKCRLESNKHRPVEKVFQHHFHVKFTRSTFYNHRRHWMSVTESVRNRYVKYGHTKRGRWSTFIREEIKGDRQMGQL